MRQNLGTFKLKDKANRSVVEISFENHRQPMEDLERLYVHKIFGSTNKIEIILQWKDHYKKVVLQDGLPISEEVKNVQNSRLPEIQQPVDKMQPVAQSPEPDGVDSVQRTEPTAPAEGNQQAANAGDNTPSA